MGKFLKKDGSTIIDLKTINLGRNFTGYTDGLGLPILVFPQLANWVEVNKIDTTNLNAVTINNPGQIHFLYDGQTDRSSYTLLPFSIADGGNLSSMAKQGYLQIKPTWTTGGASGWKRYLIAGYTDNDIILTFNN